MEGLANVVAGSCEKIGKGTDSLTVAARNVAFGCYSPSIFSQVPASNFRARKYNKPRGVPSRNFVPVTILANSRTSTTGC
jgi:hypothetical protein